MRKWKCQFSYNLAGQQQNGFGNGGSFSQSNGYPASNQPSAPSGKICNELFFCKKYQLSKLVRNWRFAMIQIIIILIS